MFQFHSFSKRVTISFFFMVESKQFPCVSVPCFLHLFICWYAYRLVPFLSCFEQFFNNVHVSVCSGVSEAAEGHPVKTKLFLPECKVFLFTKAAHAPNGHFPALLLSYFIFWGSVSCQHCTRFLFIFYH